MSIHIPEIAIVPIDRYRLRWRFEYFDKAPVWGCWNGSSPRVEDSAWRKTKNNLAFVIVEAENMRNFEIKRMVSVEGSHYASMQWDAYANAPHFGLKEEHGKIKLQEKIAGLSVLTREKRVTCYVNGTIEISALSDHDMTWDIREHKAGV